MSHRCLFSHRTARNLALVLGGLFAVALATVRTAEPRFFSDDPIAREPEVADASGAQPWDIDLFYDLSYNLFVTPRRVPANVRRRTSTPSTRCPTPAGSPTGLAHAN